jgi:hypothetical protein
MTKRTTTIPRDLYLEICAEVFEDPAPEPSPGEGEPTRGVEVDVTGYFLLDFRI